jgi:hypothetical protein
MVKHSIIISRNKIAILGYSALSDKPIPTLSFCFPSPLLAQIFQAMSSWVVKWFGGHSLLHRVAACCRCAAGDVGFSATGQCDFCFLD